MSPAIEFGFDEPLRDSEQFDAQFLHNFGPENPISLGARALCGAISTRLGPGETEPLRSECCQICVALTV